MTSPGVTSMFHNQADVGTQRALGMAGTFLDPSRGAHALARQNASRAGGYVGAGVGFAASGIGGAMTGQALGDMFGGLMAEIPLLGGAMDWGEREEAQMLSNMAGVQFGTMGRVSMGGRDMGLGGRGINAQSSMRLGNNLQKFSNQMAGVKPTSVGGGTFNEADIRNLVSASADSGLLDAASNIDQIEGTVKKVMSLVGRLGKLTGDPDFRNNIRELGKMKSLGFEMDQAVDALAGMGRYGIAAGMSRTQLMHQAIEPAMARFAAAGLTPGLGVTHGAYGAAQGRMQAGIGTAVQQSLMGDVGQRVTESNAAFLSGHAKMLLPNMFAAKDGQITLDPSKINDIATAGSINLREMAATGRQTMVDVAQKVAQQRASKEGREVRAGEFRDILGEMTSRQQEWLSELGTKMTPEQTMRANLAMAAGLQKQGLGQWESLMSVAGGDPMQARMLLNTATNPKYHERNIAQLDTAIKKAESEVQRQSDRAERAWSDENRGTGAYKAFRAIGRGISDIFTDEVNVSDIMDAEEEARNIAMQEEMATSGTRTYRSGMVGKVSKLSVELQKKARGRIEGGLNLGSRTLKNTLFGITTAETNNNNIVDVLSGTQGALNEEEMIRMQRLSGDYDTVGGWVARGALGDVARRSADKGSGGATTRAARAEYNRLMKGAAESAKVIGTAQRRSTKDQRSMENKLYSKFEEFGLDGADVMATIKTDLLQKLKRAGKQGKGTTSDQLLEMVSGSLSGYKDKNGNPISPERIQQIMKSDPTMMKEVFTKFGMEEGGTAAKGSLMTAGAVGTAFEKYTTVENLENLEDLEETMNDDLLDWLDDSGLTGGIDWETGNDRFKSVGAQEAFGAVHDTMGGGKSAREGAEQTYVTALYAQARSGGAGAKSAQQQLARMQKKRGASFDKQLDAAKKTHGDMSDEGKKYLGKYMDMFRAKAAEANITLETGEDFIKMIEEGIAGKGPAGKIMSKDALIAIQSQMKGGGAVAVDEGGTGVAAASKTVDKLKSEKTAAENLHKLWTAPGGIAEKFDSGMGKLAVAVQKLNEVADKIKMTPP